MKKLFGKKILAAAITVFMLGGLMACGSKTDTSTTSDLNTNTSTTKESTESSNSGESAAKPSGKIVVGGWPSGDDAFKAALDGFNKEYPDIEVEFQFTDTTSHHQALQTSLAAGTGAPDVAMVEGAYIAQYRDSSALTNLYDAPYNAGDLKDDFVAYKWDQAISSDGSRIVAIPWDIGPCSYFYRTDIFEECGLPTDPEEVAKLMSTWDGVLKVAEKVSIPGKRWLLPDASYMYFELFCNRDYYDENLNLQIEREGDLDCLNAVIKMRQNGWDMNVDMWSNEAYAAYADGSCVSVSTGAWFGGFLKTDIDPNGSGHWGVTTLPGGVKSSNWGGSFLVIPEQSQNKEAAWAFVKYMLATTEAQNTMFKAVDYYPAYIPAWSDESIYNEPDPYFCNQTPKKLWAEIAADLQPVNTTMMDTTAEGCIYSSVNAGLQQGLDAEGIRSLVASDIEAATAEVKQQQIQVLKDAGVWKE
ncbi:MAG: Extracellular solute-binding protein [Lachnoclostridium sp.]|jgi:ABC-type glycerol-3-phosphate transport system substrate-binding protein